MSWLFMTDMNSSEDKEMLFMLSQAKMSLNACQLLLSLNFFVAKLFHPVEGERTADQLEGEQFFLKNQTCYPYSADC